MKTFFDVFIPSTVDFAFYLNEVPAISGNEPRVCVKISGVLALHFTRKKRSLLSKQKRLWPVFINYRPKSLSAILHSARFLILNQQQRDAVRRHALKHSTAFAVHRGPGCDRALRERQVEPDRLERVVPQGDSAAAVRGDKGIGVHVGMLDPLIRAEGAQQQEVLVLAGAGRRPSLRKRGARGQRPRG